MGPAAIVWLLGLSQIIGYGTLYYSYSILAGSIASSFGWPVSWLYGSFSLALIAGGLAAPAAGRLIDRHGGGAVMAVGSALSAAALVAAALAPNAIAFTLAIVTIPRLALALGMALPPATQLSILPLFAVIVWGVDEVARAARRSIDRR